MSRRTLVDSTAQVAPSQEVARLFEDRGDEVRRLEAGGSALPESAAGKIPRDVVRWTEAGEIYEKLLKLEAGGYLPDRVVCVDPWAACLATRSRGMFPGSRWMYVAGVREPGWDDIDDYLKALPFDEVATLDSLRASGGFQSPRTSTLHSRRPGSWEWRSLSVPLRPLVVARHRDSVHHARVFLDSFTASDATVVIIPDRPDPALESYVGLFAEAHSSVQVQMASMDEVERLLREASSVLWCDTSILLPRDFFRGAGRTGSLPQAVVGRQAAVHILTGNLDPFEHYAALVEAHSKDLSRARAAIYFDRPATARLDRTVLEALIRDDLSGAPLRDDVLLRLPEIS